MNIKCLQCGAKMNRTIGNYKYDISGLKNITLNHVEIFVCTKCGEDEVAIPNMGQLHNLLATEAASQSARLLPEEIRFLRSHLGFSGVDFARAIDVAPETVSRWETGKEKMSLSLERFLRTLVLYRCGPFRHYEQDLTQYGNITKSKPIRRAFVAKGNKWREAA